MRDRDLEVDETVAKLRRYLAWRADVKPHEVREYEGVKTKSQKNDVFFPHPPSTSFQLSATDVAAEAATGKVYLHPHPDALGRPVVVVRCARHVIGQHPLRSSIRLASFVLDQAVAALPPATDTLVGVFDLRGFGPANADLAFARFLVDACFLYYPRRLGAVLFVDAPWAFRPVWAVVKPLLRKYGALVRFVSAADVVAAFDDDSLAPKDFLNR